MLITFLLYNYRRYILLNSGAGNAYTVTILENLRLRIEMIYKKNETLLLYKFGNIIIHLSVENLQWQIDCGGFHFF